MKNSPKVSVCMIVRNDLPFLRPCLSAVCEYADEVVVLDTGSTDGSVEWLDDYVDPVVDFKFKQISHEAFLEMGFANARNKAAEYATGDWIQSLDADEMVSAEQRSLIKPFLMGARRDVLSISTFTYRHKPGFDPLDWTAIANGTEWDIMQHRRFYRRGRGIAWQGYIHEELYRGPTNAMGFSADSPFKHLHFSNFRNWGDAEFKSGMYAYMLMRAFKEPARQAGTNRWWFDVFVPEHKVRLEQESKSFVEKYLGLKKVL